MRIGQAHAGFTVVEMLVTVVLAGIFLAFFVQMFRATAAQQLSLVRQSIANDIAKSNLAKFPTAGSLTNAPTSYVCDTNTTGNTNNLTVSAAVAGTSVLADSQKETDPGTIGELVQTVRAYSPRGCGPNLPIKVVSTVEYGFVGQRDKVEYATYVF